MWQILFFSEPWLGPLPFRIWTIDQNSYWPSIPENNERTFWKWSS